MKIEDVMKLVNAGFSKQEIMAIAGAEHPQEASDQAPEPQQIPENTDSKEPDPKPDPKPSPENSYDQAISQLTAQVSQLTSLVQKSNLLRMEQPDIQPETAEDVIASIIFPTYKGDNK